MHSLVFNFMNQISSGKYLRLCGSAGLSIQLAHRGIPAEAIRAAESELQTPPFAVIPQWLFGAADLDFQSTRGEGEAVDTLKEALEAYLKVSDEKKACLVSLSKKPVCLRKDYAHESRHTPNQPAVMAQTFTLEVCWGGKAFFRVDITEGYAGTGLPPCERIRGESLGCEDAINVCSLEQLVNDMLWAFHATHHLSLNENKHYYRLKLIAILIDNGTLSNALSDGLNKVVCSFYSPAVPPPHVSTTEASTQTGNPENSVDIPKATRLNQRSAATQTNLSLRHIFQGWKRHHHAATQTESPKPLVAPELPAAVKIRGLLKNIQPLS